jgi:glycosyltransferase involved in cell wall biosynthesis
MIDALERHGCEAVPLSTIGPLQIAGRTYDRIARRLRRPRWQHTQRTAVARELARGTRRRIGKAAPLDFILAPAASPHVAFLEAEPPVVYLSDTTYRLIHGYYPGFGSKGEDARREGDELERRALARADLVLYPSTWPVRSAVEEYGVDPARIHVVPFGASLDEVPSRETALAPKPASPVDLLWIGGEWERKGGAIAVRTAELLRAAGLDARLTVVGCIPPGVEAIESLRIVPRIDKRSPEGRALFQRLMLDAHFLLLPSRAECYGIVFCEASAHGTPAISTATGGIAGAVHAGIDGYLFPPDAAAEDYAITIRTLLADPERYRALCRSSRELFESTLNWDRWAATVLALVDRLPERG